jgi:hypothetical protein
MRAIEVAHDMSAKTLLSGVTLPAGQTAEQDLSGVIDSIFNHPNVGPFVGRQLIQHLVSGRLSPFYTPFIPTAMILLIEWAGLFRSETRAQFTSWALRHF